MNALRNERPILFSAAMVRAILAGEKTQTRRVVGLDASLRRRGCVSLEGAWVDGVGDQYMHVPGPDETSHRLFCPHGYTLDRLWVREGLRLDLAGRWVYAADGRSLPAMPELEAWSKGKKATRAPSLLMPRWAMRTWLEIRSVRVERLQEISNKDAWEEGCRKFPDDGTYWAEDPGGSVVLADTPRDEFQSLWDSFDRKPSEKWAGNPWVWVVEFRRVE